jgi:hypothetical protein
MKLSLSAHTKQSGASSIHYIILKCEQERSECRALRSIMQQFEYEFAKFKGTLMR